MVSALLRTVAVLASLVLLVSFSLFAVDQAGGASQQAQAEVNGSGAQTVGPALGGAGAEQGARATIDQVDRALVSPVHALAPGQAGGWGARTFELVCGLLFYGVLLSILARSSAFAHRHPPAAPDPARARF